MKEPLTQKEFETRLLEKHSPIYRKNWSNYPNSTFYYDTPNFDGGTNNIGIYTNLTIYSLEPA